MTKIPRSQRPLLPQPVGMTHWVRPGTEICPLGQSESSRKRRGRQGLPGRRQVWRSWKQSVDSLLQSAVSAKVPAGQTFLYRHGEEEGRGGWGEREHARLAGISVKTSEYIVYGQKPAVSKPPTNTPTTCWLDTLAAVRHRYFSRCTI